MVKLLKQIGHDTRGATAIEYGLIVALIFLAIAGAVGSFSSNAIGMWTMVSQLFASSSA